jgi:murein DD-endopeptidase MepM/ murein hydrolase activator NlpD
MTPQISKSVGRWEKGARNLKADIKTVQRLLQTATSVLQAPELDPKGVDGMIEHPPANSATINAIEAFQSRFTSAVDGVIGPGSQTWDTLMSTAAAHPPDSLTITAGQWFFPFPVTSTFSWEERPRAFASPRAGGSRLHAGCDLYFPVGTPIHAVADGVVTRGPYAFYCETFALEIDHGSILARYGEIQETTEVCAGQKVRAGQRIAKVGHLVGIQVPSDMLHFELYDKSRSGLLTVSAGAESASKNGIPFMRRKDLLDPTPNLNLWRGNPSPP